MLWVRYTVETTRYERGHRKVLLVNHVIDKRYSDGGFVVTHDRVRREAISVEKLQQVLFSNIFVTTMRWTWHRTR